jgi:hypothetical protein
MATLIELWESKPEVVTPEWEETYQQAVKEAQSLLKDRKSGVDPRRVEPQ